jgi:hypothetical protein
MLKQRKIIKSIAFVLLFTQLGCGKKLIDHAKIGEFVFINQTSYAITYEVKIGKYNILPHSTTTVIDTQDSGITAEANDYSSPFNEEYMVASIDPLVVRFDQTKCWMVNRNSDHSLLNIKSYVAEKLGDRKFKFTYTFTEADYNRATICP